MSNNEIYLHPIRAADRLFFGSENHLVREFLSSPLHPINIIFNLSGFDIKLSDKNLDDLKIDVYNMSICDEELMVDELTRFSNKIVNIVNKIMYFISYGANVFIMCKTGINKAPLVAAYYLLLVAKNNAPNSVHNCEILNKIHNFSCQAGTNLLTNRSFKRVLHDQRKLTPTCECWKVTVYDYRPQVEDDVKN